MTTTEERVSRLEGTHEHFATKADVADVKTELANVKAELAEAKAELKAELANVKADVQELRSELKAMETRLWTIDSQRRRDSSHIAFPVLAVGCTRQLSLCDNTST